MNPAILCLGGLGLVFGTGLAVAARVFHVETDPRVDIVNDLLPGANCGGCGLPGCSGFADALVKGDIELAKCTVCGAEAKVQIADALGLVATEGEKQRAVCMCSGGNDECRFKYHYDGVMDCRAAALLGGGDKSCEYGCLGLGTCAEICPFDAISMNENGIPVVDDKKCTACGKCVTACPKNLFSLVSAASKVYVGCSSNDKGARVKSVCDTGCIGCTLCAKVCPFDAITMKDNLAIIDPAKCRNCELCVKKCPVKCIETEVVDRFRAVITNDCVGCTLCVRVCPTDAIEGERKEKHKVKLEKCIGCGACVEKCPKKAIVMKDV